MGNDWAATRPLPRTSLLHLAFGQVEEGVLTGVILVASQSRIHRDKPDGVPRAASINSLKAESEGPKAEKGPGLGQVSYVL